MAVVTAASPLHTPLCDLLGCRHPILLAGMGGVARHRLAGAVANAGGFPVLGMVREPCERISAEIAALRQQCNTPFAVNLIPAATNASLLQAQARICIELDVPFITLFWDVDTKLIQQLISEGCKIIHQVGNRRDAEAALAAGVDVLIAQGYEAGGHVRGKVSSLPLLTELLSFSPVPVVASGGIGNGKSLAMALTLGAQGVSLGTAFLATTEANAHNHHKQRIVKANADDTIYTALFHRNWHELAPVRVLANAVTRGERIDTNNQGYPIVIGHQDNQAVHLCSTDSPLADATGDIDDMALYSGQSCGQINRVMSAKQRVDTLITEAILSIEQCQK